MIDRDRPLAVLDGQQRPGLQQIDQGRSLRGLVVIMGCIAFWILVAGLFEHLL